MMGNQPIMSYKIASFRCWIQNAAKVMRDLKRITTCIFIKGYVVAIKNYTK